MLFASVQSAIPGNKVHLNFGAGEEVAMQEATGGDTASSSDVERRINELLSVKAKHEERIKFILQLKEKRSILEAKREQLKDKTQKKEQEDRQERERREQEAKLRSELAEERAFLLDEIARERKEFEEERKQSALRREKDEAEHKKKEEEWESKLREMDELVDTQKEEIKRHLKRIESLKQEIEAADKLESESSDEEKDNEEEDGEAAESSDEDSDEEKGDGDDDSGSSSSSDSESEEESNDEEETGQKDTGGSAIMFNQMKAGAKKLRRSASAQKDIGSTIKATDNKPPSTSTEETPEQEGALKEKLEGSAALYSRMSKGAQEMKGSPTALEIFKRRASSSLERKKGQRSADAKQDAATSEEGKMPETPEGVDEGEKPSDASPPTAEEPKKGSAPKLLSRLSTLYGWKNSPGSSEGGSGVKSEDGKNVAETKSEVSPSAVPEITVQEEHSKPALLRGPSVFKELRAEMQKKKEEQVAQGGLAIPGKPQQKERNLATMMDVIMKGSVIAVPSTKRSEAFLTVRSATQQRKGMSMIRRDDEKSRLEARKKLQEELEVKERQFEEALKEKMVKEQDLQNLVQQSQLMQPALRKGSVIGGRPVTLLAPTTAIGLPELVPGSRIVRAKKADELSEQDEEVMLKESRMLDRKKKQMEADAQFSKMVESLMRMEKAFREAEEEKQKMREEIARLQAVIEKGAPDNQQQQDNGVILAESIAVPPPPIFIPAPPPAAPPVAPPSPTAPPLVAPPLSPTSPVPPPPVLPREDSSGYLDQISAGKVVLKKVTAEDEKARRAAAPPPGGVIESLMDTLTAAMTVRKLAMADSDDEEDNDDDDWDDNEFEDEGRDSDSVFDF